MLALNQQNEEANIQVSVEPWYLAEEQLHQMPLVELKHRVVFEVCLHLEDQRDLKVDCQQWVSPVNVVAC